MRYRITAEHTLGQSVSHPCRTGVYDDPVDLLDATIEAVDTEAAVREGTRQLFELCAERQPCACGRAPGSARWWDSATVSAIPLAYERDGQYYLDLPSGVTVEVDSCGIDPDHYSPEVVAEFDAIETVVLPDGTKIS